MLETAAADRQTDRVLDAPWRPSRLRQVTWFAGLVAACFLAAGIGSAITSTSVNGWYQTLAKPDWSPPDWVFGPVWTVLYFSMAVAAWLVWRGGGFAPARACLAWFGIQLILNVLWSAIFFGAQLPGFALVEITMLWIAIGATSFAFWKCSRVAALLLGPYLAWTAFAAFLNFSIWRMN